MKAGSIGARVGRIAAAGADVVVGGEWLVRGGVRVATGLRDVLRFGDDVLPTAGQAGQAAAVTRISPTALIAAVVARIAPTAVNAAADDPTTVRVSPPTPVSDELFGRTLLDPPGTTVLNPPTGTPRPTRRTPGTWPGLDR